MAIRVQVTSPLAKVYYRAGLALAPGAAQYRVSPAQYTALAADPRLVVVWLDEQDAPARESDPAAPLAPAAALGDLDPAVGGLSGSGYLAGVATLDGKITPLAEMKVDELRELAGQMGIPGAAKLKKAELVTAIAATEVQYPVNDQAVAPPEPPADPVVEGA